MLIAEINQLEAWCTDIGNAYLEAYTEELLYIIAGPEFGELEGHTMIVVKALYGTKTGGIRWWERFSKVLCKMGFYPSKAEDDIWMRDMGDHYEYITRYVDDLTMISRNPQELLRILCEEHHFKLKGNELIRYHLGSNFSRDEKGVVCMSPTKYIKHMMDNYICMFVSALKTLYRLPLERGNHLELDTSDELDEEDTKKYQSLIGAL